MTSTVFDCFANSERATKAIARIQARKYDTDSWNMLIKEAASKNIDEVEPFYEELLNTYPTCGRFWKAYIEHEMKFRRYDKVSKLFQRSLEEVLNIDLYKCYLNYVRETKANEPDLILKAYRYTLDKVGTDPNAISIYNDHIQFLKEREVDGSYLEDQKRKAVIKAYQEGIVNPMFHIESLWKDFIKYVESFNQSLANRMSEDSRDHINARHVAKEWEVKIRGLNRSWPAAPATFSYEELRQVEIWRRYIQWEKSNPLRALNNAIVIRRVSYAYKQCLLCFGRHPNFWHEYASYLEEQIKSLSDKDVELNRKLTKEQTTLFERAIKGLMKDNLFIHFSYADLLESRNDKRKALEIYNNLIEYGKDNEQIDLTLVYIQLLRFSRRTDGIKAARLVFKRAREDKRCGHQIYTAAALMEFHCSKDQAVAKKIFELGLKKFETCPDFILSYIQFMSSLNEENNTRVLYERVLTTCSLEPKDTVEIWNSFLEFEAGIGDASSISKVEKRRADALEKVFPRCTEASWAVDKYKFQDLFPCSINELRSLNYDEQQSSTNSSSIKQVLISIGSGSGSLSQQITNNNHGNNKSSNNNGASSKYNRYQPQRIKSNGPSQLSISDGFNDQVDSEAVFATSALNSTNMCSPDLDQMIPFKPVMAPAYGAHTVPGGVFPPPPAVGNLLSRLPQAGTFWGPFVDIEEVCNIIRVCDFDELFNNLVEHRREVSDKPRTKRVRTD